MDQSSKIIQVKKNIVMITACPPPTEAGMLTYSEKAAKAVTLLTEDMKEKS